MSVGAGLQGRVALVTGAGHGIGRLYALALARQGAHIVVNDLDVQACAAVVAEIKACAGNAVEFAGDVARAEDARGMVAAARDSFGRIDIVICNAGFVRDRAFHNMSLDDLDQVLNVHLRGTAYVTHAAWPHLRAQRYGRVVFTTSSAGLWGNFGQANYSAAKLGIVGLMHTLDLEGAPRGICVNTVAPFVMTRMGEGIFPEHLRPHMGGESVVALVSYLCSERCAVSGEIFEVGAGRIRRVRMLAGEGVLPGAACTPDDVAGCMDRLLMQPTTKGFADVWAAFRDFMSHCETGSGQAVKEKW